jgi:hypothetical protein
MMILTFIFISKENQTTLFYFLTPIKNPENLLKFAGFKI